MPIPILRRRYGSSRGNVHVTRELIELSFSLVDLEVYGYALGQRDETISVGGEN